ncbi:hypothetical protein ACTUM6_03330 [Basfia succiniciproducens]|uniref:hypothetical protein n=1 Tax=Basfia succiniciproducens TaxID=653940 RepID=UPI003FCC7199
MRFNTYINSAKCLEWGLNANQGALFDLLNQASSWAKEIVIDGVVYYWVSRNVVVDELPLFYSKADTVYRHFLGLAKKGLIIYLKQGKFGDKDLIRLTDKGKTWNEFKQKESPNNSEMNPNNSEMNPNNSEMNPTDNNTKDHNTKDHNTNLTVSNARAKKQTVFDLLAEFGIDGQLAEDFITHRKACKATITKTALDGFQREADKAGIPIQEAVAISIERGWRGFKASWDWQGNGQQRGREPKSNLNMPWNTPEMWEDAF